MFEQDVKKAEQLFLKVQDEGESNAAPTQDVSNVLIKCSSAFSRITESVSDHWREMLACYQVCMDGETVFHPKFCRKSFGAACTSGGYEAEASSSHAVEPLTVTHLQSLSH